MRHLSLRNHLFLIEVSTVLVQQFHLVYVFKPKEDKNNQSIWISLFQKYVFNLAKTFAQRFKKVFLTKILQHANHSQSRLLQPKSRSQVDFNVPIDDEFQVTDSTRITAAKETITIFSTKEAVVVLISLGRPRAKTQNYHYHISLVK